MFNKKIKTLFKRRSKKRKNKVQRILTQSQKEGSLELISPETKSDKSKNLDYKVKNDKLWDLLSTKYFVHKHQQVIKGVLFRERPKHILILLGLDLFDLTSVARIT